MKDRKVPRVITGENIGQLDATRMPRYAGIATFGLLPQAHEVTRADIAIIGIPFDSGVSYRPGARFGPAHVRDASRLLRPFNPETGASPFASQQIVDAGDFAVNPFNIEEALTTIERDHKELSQQAKRILTIGGDHTITLPILRSLHSQHGPISVIHFDAHLDTWDTYFGADYTHGTTFRRAAEEKLLDPEGCMHLGIRGPLYSAQNLADDKALGFQIFSSIEFQDLGVPEAIKKMLARVGDRPVYISIDIDVLDPAHAPGTGTPEAGGLTSRELLAVIRASSALNIVGADVVEVAPAYDFAQITGIAASHVMYELASAMTPRSTLARVRKG
jgi:agmatinase